MRICSQCQAESTDEAQFCAQCGAGLVQACAQCGKPLPRQAAFCPICGVATGESAPASGTITHGPGAPSGRARVQEVLAGPPGAGGERRQATILFSDLSGFTALGERLDPERVRAIMERIKQDAVRIVESHGGIVNQFVGDEVMALFGIPIAHEDDPPRAVRAAMELHGQVQALSSELEPQIGQPITLHTGIHSGLVVTGEHDGREGVYSVTGDAVNTAARLVAHAAPDEILVTRETQRRIAPFYDLEALEPVQAKGKSQPIRPYRVLQKTSVRTRLDISAQRGFTPFAGRTAEFRLLREAISAVRAGRGRLVTVAGEAGVGKSRLLHEFQQKLRQGGFTLVRGQCQITGSGTPYAPLVDALRDLWEIAPGVAEEAKAVKTKVLAVDAALERYLPQYLHVLSMPSAEYPLPDTLKSEELHRTIQLGLSALLVQMARQAPVAILLEDWHWADEASVLVVKYLSGLIAEVPLLALVNYRPEYSEGWGHLQYHHHLMLAPLDQETTGNILQHVLGVERLPGGLLERIHERTGGNPFFIEEMGRTLLEEGTVQVRSVREAVLMQSLDGLVLPDTVQAVIRTRLDRLGEETLRVLRVAAVVGQEFPGAILERLLGEKGGIFEALELLKSLGLVRQVRLMPDALFSFQHKITQEVAYETLLLQQRRRLHQEVAEAMEALHGDRLAEMAEVLAEHYNHAEIWDQAACHFLTAAERAKAHFSYQTALRLCDAALAAAERSEDFLPLRLAGHELRGDLLSLAGDLAASNVAYENARGLAPAGPAVLRIENKIHHREKLRVDGGEVTCFLHGGGKQTLVLHQAIPYGLETFQGVVELLCQDFRVVTYFPLGSGDSDRQPEGYDGAQELETARKVMETYGEHDVTAVGVSKGGRLLLGLAGTDPHLFQRIVTVNSGIEPFAPQMRFPPDWGHPLWKRLLDLRPSREAGKTTAHDSLEVFMGIVMSDPGLEEFIRIRLPRMRELPRETVEYFFDHEKAAWVDDADLRAIRVPTLVLASTHDLTLPEQASRYVASQIPGALFYLFEGRGHLPNLVALGEFCEVLRQYMLTGQVEGAEPLGGR